MLADSTSLFFCISFIILAATDHAVARPIVEAFLLGVIFIVNFSIGYRHERDKVLLLYFVSLFLNDNQY